MNKKAETLYNKSVEKIKELSKKISFPMIQGFYTTKEIKMKISGTPEIASSIAMLLKRDLEEDLFLVNIRNSIITIMDGDKKEMDKTEIKDRFNWRNREEINLLFVKYKMPHVVYPSFFLLENTTQKGDE